MDFEKTWSTWEAADALAAAKPGEASRATGHDGYRDRDKWAGCTWEQAVEYARRGWDNGAAALAKASANLTYDEVPAFEYSLSDEGSEPDVAAFLAGEELNMGDMRMVPQAKPLIRIGVDMSVSYTVTAAQMRRVGESVFAAVEKLRTAGYPTEVHVIFAVRGRSGGLCVTRIVAQDVSQPVHASLLAFFIAHPAALRRVMFALCETYSDEVRDDFGFRRGRGYGSPSSYTVKETYDEWAPSANAGELALTQWLAGLIARRS